MPEEHFYSADRHLTQRNAELGGAARLPDKERFQNICTAAVLSALLHAHAELVHNQSAEWPQTDERDLLE